MKRLGVFVLLMFLLVGSLAVVSADTVTFEGIEYTWYDTFNNHNAGDVDVYNYCQLYQTSTNCGYQTVNCGMIHEHEWEYQEACNYWVYDNCGTSSPAWRIALLGCLDMDVVCDMEPTFSLCNPVVEDCINDVDDDGDGFVDCADSDCDSDAACIVSGAYWADANGNKISASDKGDTVKLIVPGVEETGDVDFVVEERTGTNENVFTSEEPLVGSVVDGDAVAFWQITQEEYDKTEDHDSYYFSALGEESEGLAVSGLSDDDPMNLTIIGPDCGEVIYKGDSTTVIVSLLDADDLINGSVTINGATYTDLSNGIHSFEHIFITDGNIQIILTGTNSRGHIKSTITNVMVVDKSKYGVYVAACIDKPEDYADIDDSIVMFDARSTRAVEWDPSRSVGSELVELAGPIIGNYDSLNFLWDFSDGRENPFYSGSDSLAYYFYKTFTEAGNNWAELTVELV